MKKGFMTIIMALVVSMMVMPTTAFATPTLGEVVNYALFDSVKDTGAEAVVLTDTDGISDDITAFLLFEFAGFAPDLTFGIYDFDVDTAGNVTLLDKLQLFEGSDSPTSTWSGDAASTTVDFNIADGTATANSVTADIGKTFGFYLTTPEGSAGYTYYSHTALNPEDPDGFDHALIFDLVTDSYNYQDFFSGSDVIVAFEDLYGGGDADYNDFVVGVTDVNPAPVPEPATLLLLGSGIIGLALYGRRKKTI